MPTIENYHDTKMETFLSSGLLVDEKTSDHSPPCCVFQNSRCPLNEYDDKISKLHIDSEKPKVLSYSSFGTCLMLHQEWLQTTIHKEILRCTSSNRGTVSSFIDDVVIAYISGNSPDMLLSVLACSSPEVKPAIPALLNTRWTPSEMIASLQSKKNNNGEVSVRSSVTILLHDGSDAFTTAAQLVSKGLRETNNQYSVTLPIPKFSQPSMTSTIGILPSSRSSTTNSTITSNHSFHERMETTIRTASTSDALILFTSGTTGGSKGVRLSHRALLVQALAKIGEPCGYSEATSMLATTVPLFHVGGFSSFLAVLLARGRLIFPEQDGSIVSKFKVQDISNSLHDPYLPANTLVVVPAMLSSYFDAESKTGRKARRFLETRLLLIGGQSASKDLLAQCRYCFPNAKIVQTYACTEAASSMTYLHLKSHQGHLDNPALVGSQPNGSCAGSPPNHVKLCIFDRKSPPKNVEEIMRHKAITKPYELGLIATYGPHVMNGYWHRGKHRKNHFRDFTGVTSNDYRWFIGTDLGFWDDQGRLWFAGRAKDVVRTGGETVLAREVEQVVLGHPDVVECAIFPRMDSRYGEAVACAIVTKQGKSDAILNIGTIKQWCRQKGLAGYKQPKFVFMVSSLPRNSSGKILKHKLVAKYGHPEIQSKL